MATKKPATKTVNKSQAIRDYVKTHRRAKASEVVEALGKKGIKVTPQLVYNAKPKKKKKTTRSKPAVAATENGSPVQNLREAGDLMLKAADLVMQAGAKEAHKLIDAAQKIVAKVRG